MRREGQDGYVGANGKINGGPHVYVGIAADVRVKSEMYQWQIGHWLWLVGGKNWSGPEMENRKEKLVGDQKRKCKDGLKIWAPCLGELCNVVPYWSRYSESGKLSKHMRELE